MVEADLEEQKKAVLAQEMQKADPKVSYYCKMYAVEQAVKFEKRAKEINGLVSAVLAAMEKEKPNLALDRENDRFHCEALALKVFGNADKVDRAGRADMGTAKTFLAASYFLEILNHFGPLDGDLLEKQRYAVWRAAEIRKAVREGRPALPPGGSKGEETGDLPPAYEDLPPAYGGSSSAAGNSSFSTAGGSFSAASSSISVTTPLAPPPPPLSEPQGTHLWSEPPPVAAAPSYPPAPPALPPPPATPAPVLPGQRYRLGSKVLYLPDSAHQFEPGTVWQAQPGPDDTCRYWIALRDRIQDAFEWQLVPDLAEGDAVLYLGGRGGPVQCQTVLMNDMSWPPTYLVRLPDGTEQAAAAEQLSLMLPEGSHQQPQQQGSPRAGAGHDGQPAQQPGGQLEQGAGHPPGPPAASLQQSPSIHHTMAAPRAHAPPAQPQQPDYSQTWSAGSQAWRPASPATYQAAPAQPPAPAPVQPPPSHHAAAPQPIPAAAFQLPPGHKPSVQAIMEAQKNAKYAVSSLNFEDVAAAVKYLQTALRALTTP